MKKSLFIQTAVALALAAPLLASAESELVTGSATVGGADARLNFSVIIPKVLLLQVGTSGAGNIDTLTYDYSGNPVAVGNNTPSASQGVSVRVLGNNGQVTVGAAGSGSGLVSDLDPADVIPWNQIQAASTVGTLAAPAVGANATPTLNTAKVTDRAATWNFSYLNAAVVAPGTYTGQVTYTATMP